MLRGGRDNHPRGREGEAGAAGDGKHQNKTDRKRNVHFFAAARVHRKQTTRKTFLSLFSFKFSL
jgi:hypothetical protein